MSTILTTLPRVAPSAIRTPISFVRCVKWQRAQHDRVHHREDGRSGADPERQHDERDGGEGRRIAEGATGGFQIAAHGGSDGFLPERSGGCEVSSGACALRITL